MRGRRHRGAAALALGLAVAPGPSGRGAESSPRVRPGTVVRWAGQGLEWCAVGERRFEPIDGACYYPVDLLRRPGPLELARGRGGRRETKTVRVGKFDYPVQKLTLPRHMVELSPEDLARVERENSEMARLWTLDGPRRFSLPLAAPLDPLPAGGRFGHRRIINGRTRSPHGGVDFSVAGGTPVLAAADATVALVADQFFGGNAVFLDHGDGLITMYMHMSRVDVGEGRAVRRGERVGAVGSTGRATGPHLHFGVRWRTARVDPVLLLGRPEAIQAID
ncbi:MAG TPA: M23 family metallopeptidase [Vicinamibacteria bacterium]|nr:M23 family metallopeptidase [Vicinamibacteria bacterium]